MRKALVLVVAGLMLQSPLPGGEARPIVVDGLFEDWGDAVPLAVDPLDSPGGQDLGALWVANDDDFLFFRIELNRETIFQNLPEDAAGNDLRLYLDADGSSATGLAVRGIGADLVFYFGYKGAYYYTTPTVTSWVSQNTFGVRSAPTHSAETFELALSRHEVPLQGSNSVSFYFTVGSTDSLPDAGALTYTFDTGAPAAEPIALERVNPGDVRVLSWNVRTDSPASNPEPFRRILQATNPDIINFQEIYNWTAEQTRAFVVGTLGGTWYAASAADCKTVSRWPITGWAASDENLACRVDLPDSLSRTDLVVINAHTPCCDNNAGRDQEHDRLSRLWRLAMGSAGPFSTTGNEAVVMVGDFNMVGFVRQLDTLRDGQFIDAIQYGPNFSPAREKGSLTGAPLRHTHTRETFTWQNPNGAFAPGRLDWILVGEDAATLKRNFALYTPDMPADVRAAYGLFTNDSRASDHVPLIADLEFPLPGSMDGMMAY